jgi:hypothetical protein
MSTGHAVSHALGKNAVWYWCTKNGTRCTTGSTNVRKTARTTLTECPLIDGAAYLNRYLKRLNIWEFEVQMANVYGLLRARVCWNMYETLLSICYLCDCFVRRDMNIAIVCVWQSAHCPDFVWLVRGLRSSVAVYNREPKSK